jgi:hypothetical protein
VAPGTKSPIVVNRYDDAQRATAAKLINSNASNATKFTNPGPSKTRFVTPTRLVDDVAQSPALPKQSSNTTADTSRCDVTSLEARKKPKLYEDEAFPYANVTIDTTSNIGPSKQPAEVACSTNASIGVAAKPVHILKEIPKAPKVNLTPRLSPLVARAARSTATTDVDKEVMELSHLPEVSSDAQPYFKYSVFQKMWSGRRSENGEIATEITVHSFMNIHKANAQAKRLFEGSKDQHTRYLLVEWSKQRDEYDCSVFISTISPFDYRAKKSYLKTYVQRNCVSKFANQTPEALKATPFISGNG